LVTHLLLVQTFRVRVFVGKLKTKIMITKTEDRHAKRKEAVEAKKVLNKSKSWRRRRTT
jgi:hypothetical protein